jgi:hypothetical protein
MRSIASNNKTLVCFPSSFCGLQRFKMFLMLHYTKTKTRYFNNIWEVILGLDMSVYAVSANQVRDEDKDKEVDFSPYYEEGHTEIWYWRKHPNLHGWMENMYQRKGGTIEEFNGVPVKLTERDLMRLEKEIKERTLPNTSGFFFGESSDDDDAVEQDLRFVAEARMQLSLGNMVYYNSSW